MRSLVPRTGLILALLCGSGLSCAPALHNPDAVLRYRVRVDPDDGITVACRATGLHDRRPEFQILSGLGLLQDLPDHIEEVTAEDGSGRPLRVERRTEPARTLWRVDRRGADVVELSWRVRPFDPTASPEATFLEARRALLLGYTAFLAPTELTDYLPSNVEVTIDAPAKWPVWTSWPAAGDVRRPATIHHLWSGGFAAGAFRESRLATGAARVTVLTEPGLTSVTGLTVANRLIPSLRAMVDLFGAPPVGDSLAVLAVYRTVPVRNGKSMMIGVSEENSFFCLATPDRFGDLVELTALAVHECLHFYLGAAITPQPEAPYNNAPDLVWLIEGVTEYLTFRLMNETGVLSDAELARVVEKKRAKMDGAGAARGMSVASAARLLEDPAVYELVYTRGYLFARMLESVMNETCGDGAFDDVLRDLFDRYNFHRTEAWIRPEDVDAAFAARCPAAVDLIRRYGRGAEPLPGDGALEAQRKAAPDGAAWIRSGTDP